VPLIMGNWSPAFTTRHKGTSRLYSVVVSASLWRAGGGGLPSVSDEF